MKATTFNVDGLRHVEEARLLSDLAKISFSEGLFDDDVEQSVHYGVILHLCLSQIFARDKLLGLSIDDHCVVDVSELNIHSDSLIKVSGGEYVAARLNIESKDSISLLLASLEDTLHDVGV